MNSASTLPSSFNESVFIGLGSNMGDRRLHLHNALSYLERAAEIQLINTSPFLETPPWGKTDQPDFINAVSEIRTGFSPDELLEFLKQGELLLGRTPTERWGPRVIDMDILMFGSRIINDTDLIIPHKELTNRRFVLEPLLELHSELVHPKNGIPLREFLLPE